MVGIEFALLGCCSEADVMLPKVPHRLVLTAGFEALQCSIDADIAMLAMLAGALGKQ